MGHSGIGAIFIEYNTVKNRFIIKEIHPLQGITKYYFDEKIKASQMYYKLAKGSFSRVILMDLEAETILLKNYD